MNPKDDRPTPVKCLVWDLDETLWKGTLLEGEPELSDEIRQVVKQLDERGIVQAIASKNDHDHAWRQLEQLEIAEYFILPRIGWGPKSDSVRAIADRLNFAHRAIAFIDDQPTERAEVAYHLPEIQLYRAEQAPDLPGLPQFTPALTTMDSRRRRKLYQAGFQRDAARSEFRGPDEDFLRSLELVMRITRAGDEEISRVEELTLRTSQMNATGVPYSGAALRALTTDPGHEVLVATMGDRFGSHGAVGVLLLEKAAPVWRLKLLATSCRVVSFGAGSVILNWLIDQAAAAGVHLAADFRRTERNRMMEVAYGFAGFAEQDCACLGALPPPAEPDIRGLHLLPTRQQRPDTVRLEAPVLAP